MWCGEIIVQFLRPVFLKASSLSIYYRTLPIFLFTCVKFWGERFTTECMVYERKRRSLSEGTDRGTLWRCGPISQGIPPFPSPLRSPDTSPNTAVVADFITIKKFSEICLKFGNSSKLWCPYFNCMKELFLGGRTSLFSFSECKGVLERGSTAAR